MPPYYRRKRYYYRRNWWNYNRRRNKYRRRRPRGTFRRYRRRFRVRKRNFFKNFKRKLKKIKIQEWQPTHIKKCKIKGYLLLFEAGQGRFGNNFCSYKESYTPPRTPGGGGWSIQKLNLGNLYIQNTYIMNKWTRSNRSLNMCRYFGVTITLYRQPKIDYIFTYYREEPKQAGKYWYPSFHPMQMILDKHRIIVPSMQTQPLKRKNYKRVFIRPPKMFKTEWYFQQHISNFPLIHFAAVACSLQHMFLSSNSANSNVSIFTLNTNFFQRSAWQYPDAGLGYYPKQGTYMYGLRNGHYGDLKNEFKQNVIYLGDTHYNDPGTPCGTLANFQQYHKDNWGNIFYHEYFNLQRTVFLSVNPNQFFNNVTTQTKITDAIQKQEPLYFEARYNPYKDKGEGNMAYWKSVSDATNNNWEPPTDQDLIIQGYPFWLMLWGWEDYSKKLGKIQRIDDEYMLVLRSSYISEGLKAYVPLGESFVNGRAPWDRDPEEISPQDQRNWFPKWKFQKEAIDKILMSGPGVCKAEGQQSIQAFIKYDFSFKWGGDPDTMEKIYDPNSQPTTDIPSEINLTNEITNPETSIQNLIYRWDVRREMLTQTAKKRIEQCSTPTNFMFTDGIQTTTDVQLKTQAQAQKTTPEETQETLLLHLQQLQQFNSELQQRFQRLQQLTKDL
nr:MAG: ORF1 [TTV-like mini virus]